MPETPNKFPDICDPAEGLRKLGFPIEGSFDDHFKKNIEPIVKQLESIDNTLKEIKELIHSLQC
jgi:hypothetical protein